MEVVKQEPKADEANKVINNDKNNLDTGKAIDETDRGERWAVYLYRKDVINMIRGLQTISPKMRGDELVKQCFSSVRSRNFRSSSFKWLKRFPKSLSLQDLTEIYLKCR